MNIILNGCSSSGKSTLMDDFVKNSKDLFIRMGIDILWGHLLPLDYIMFNKNAHLGFYFEKDNGGLKTKTGKIGEKLTNSFISMLNTLNQDGFNVISDDVILSHNDFRKYLNLDIKTTFIIGIYCQKEECLRREKQRGDRHIGLVEGQFDVVHTFKDFYDFSVDNTTITNQSSLILDYIKNNKPKGLKEYLKTYESFNKKQ